MANAEVVRAMIESWNRGDIEGFVKHLDPEVELMPLRAELEGASYRGHEGARRMYSDLHEEWEDLRLAPEVLEEIGDTVAVRITLTSRGRASGVELAIPISSLMRFRDRKVTRLQSFSDPDGAFRAAGAE